MEGAENTEEFDSSIADVNTIKETFVFIVVLDTSVQIQQLQKLSLIFLIAYMYM